MFGHFFNLTGVMELAPLAQKLNDAIHQINHYPEEKHSGNQLCHPMDRDLYGG